MKLLLVGNKGMLGSSLSKYIPSMPEGRSATLLGCDLPEIDITDPASVEVVLGREKPDVIVNCAAYTNVDGAEKDSDIAFRVNAAGPENLAHSAVRHRATLVHISTDFIFDGAKQDPYREDDAPNPLCVYAKSKLAGEEAVRRVMPDHLIVRTAWLYGPNGKNFVDTILRIARDKGKLMVVNDQRGSPTFTGTLSEYLWKLVLRGARGTFHVAGSGACTWYDLAVEAVRCAGVNATVTPCTTADFPRPARRPPNSALDVSKAEGFLHERIPAWQQGLKQYLAART
jgi:dTDP-4-dehydrorhamnose reductase